MVAIECDQRNKNKIQDTYGDKTKHDKNKTQYGQLIL